MSREFFYFNTHYAIQVHDWIIENSGGLKGNREIGLLDSALTHIQNDLYYPTFELPPMLKPPVCDPAHTS